MTGIINLSQAMAVHGMVKVWLRCSDEETPAACWNTPRGHGRPDRTGRQLNILLALFAMLVRLSRPSRGLHTSPYGYTHQLAWEVRRRARRVRRYARDLPDANVRVCCA